MDDTSMTHPSPTLQDLEARDASRLVDLLARRQVLNSIQDHLFPSRSIRTVRAQAIRLAQSDAFGLALEQRMPPFMQRSAHDLWMAWRDQDERVRLRERLRTLRRIVADLDSLATTIRSLRPARHEDAHRPAVIGRRR